MLVERLGDLVDGVPLGGADRLAVLAVGGVAGALVLGVAGVGVVFASVHQRENLIGAMFHGRKRAPRDGSNPTLLYGYGGYGGYGGCSCGGW